MNDQFEIAIVGGNKAFRIYRLMLNSYENVNFFKNENDLIKSLNRHHQIIIIEESLDSSKLLSQLRKDANTHVIYLSSRKRFGAIFRALRNGVNDYILKDSYLYYSVQQSVVCIIKLDKSRSKPFIDSCGLMEMYPIRFKLAGMLALSA